MAGHKKIHGVVTETFSAVREYAQANGLSLSTVRELLNVLDLMEVDDKHLDSLGAIDEHVKALETEEEGAAPSLMRMAKSFLAVGESKVECKTHMYDLVDHIIEEAYCGESEDVQATKCGQ